jgi:hypothetical protein
VAIEVPVVLVATNGSSRRKLLAAADGNEPRPERGGAARFRQRSRQVAIPDDWLLLA